MKKNYLNFKKASIAFTFAALLGSVNVDAQILVSSTSNPGPIAYASFGASSTSNGVFAAINAGLHTGVISVSVVANVTEPASPTALFASGIGSSAYTSISIKPSGGNFTVNSAAAPTASIGILNLVGADNVTIDGDDAATAGLQNLSIIAAQVTTQGVACIRLASNSTTGLDGANNNTIKNCILKGSRDVATSNVISYGIQFSDGNASSTPTLGAYSSTNTTIQGNIINRCHYGIHAIGNSTAYINTGLAINTNTIGSATAADYVAFRGIDVSYTSLNTASTSVIRSNDIRVGQASATGTVIAVEVADANAGLRIERNNIHDGLNGGAVGVAGMWGIGLTSAVSNGTIVIRNNFIRDMKGGSITTLGNTNGGIGVMATASVTSLIMNNNTIAQLAAGIIGSCVQINDANATVSQFLNNIATNTVASAFNTCFYTAGTLNISGGAVDNNDYTFPASGSLGYYNGVARTALSGVAAAWSNITGKDNNSFSVTPGFISATDLHIIAGQTSALESAGTGTSTTNVAIDYDGDSRPGPVGSIYGGASAPDIGADEFDGLRACSQTSVSATASPTGVVCANTQVTLTANSAASSTYTWNVPSSGSITSTTGATVAVTPTANTQYTVVSTTFGCSSATVITLTVDRPATLTAVSSATAVCLNNSVSITASGATTYTLSNGVANGASFAPTATANYTVSGSNACGTVTVPISITVNPLPTVTIASSNASVCSGATITLTVTTTGASTFTWSTPGNPTTSSISSVPTTTTNYSVTATSAAGCTMTGVRTVSVVQTPVVPPLATPSLVCSGSSTTLQISGATNYTWLPGNANTSSIVVTPATVTVITPLTFTVYENNAGCTNTQVISIEVHPLPGLFAIVNPTAVCAGSQATLTAGGATSFTWTPVTTPATGANVTIMPTQPTTYTYTGNDGTCTAVSTISVPVNPVPVLTVAATPTAICVGQTAILTASGAVTYSWTTFTSTTTLTGSNVAVTPTVTTSYNIVGPNSFGCLGNTTQVVIVNPLPVINVTPASTIICLGKIANLTASGAISYTWDANANNASTPGVTVSPTATTGVIVSGSNSFGCINVKTATVNVFNQSFSAPTSTPICLNSSLTLTSSGANTYTWSPGNLHTPSILVNPTVTTSYSVSGTSTVQNNTAILSCQANYFFTVTVNPNPTVTAVANRTVICRGETASLTASGATNYTWTPIPASGTGSAVVVTSNDFPNYINSTTYTVVGANANNCKHSTTILIATSGCVGIEAVAAANRDLLIFPNPNNGEFTVKSDAAINLTLINQLGQVIKTITLSDSNNHTEMISGVENGIYFVVGANENGRVSQKIIINK